MTLTDILGKLGVLVRDEGRLIKITDSLYEPHIQGLVPADFIVPVMEASMEEQDGNLQLSYRPLEYAEGMVVSIQEGEFDNLSIEGHGRFYDTISGTQVKIGTLPVNVSEGLQSILQRQETSVPDVSEKSIFGVFSHNFGALDMQLYVPEEKVKDIKTIMESLNGIIEPMPDLMYSTAEPPRMQGIEMVCANIMHDLEQVRSSFLTLGYELDLVHLEGKYGRDLPYKRMWTIEVNDAWQARHEDPMDLPRAVFLVYAMDFMDPDRLNMQIYAPQHEIGNIEALLFANDLAYRDELVDAENSIFPPPSDERIGTLFAHTGIDMETMAMLLDDYHFQAVTLNNSDDRQAMRRLQVWNADVDISWEYSPLYNEYKPEPGINVLAVYEQAARSTYMQVYILEKHAGKVQAMFDGRREISLFPSIDEDASDRCLGEGVVFRAANSSFHPRVIVPSFAREGINLHLMGVTGMTQERRYQSDAVQRAYNNLFG